MNFRYARKILVPVSLLFSCCVGVTHSAAQPPPSRTHTTCTKSPTIVKTWTSQISGSLVNSGQSPTAKEIAVYVENYRTRNKSLPNPFIKIAAMSETERLAAGEIVLWESGSVMVLVDRFQQPGPKGLVIPKAPGIWFPVDASAVVMAELERASVAVSDAFIFVAGKKCGIDTISDIFVHEPPNLGVQQLHVHIRPNWSFSPSDRQDDFYRQVSDKLRSLLK